GPTSVEPDRPRDRLEMRRRVTHVEAGREDALVEEVERVLLGVADGAHDLVAPASHAEGGLAAVGLGGGHRRVGVGTTGSEFPFRLPGEPPCALDIAKEVGARVLDRLVAADGPAALDADPG